jgi:hypothetical protein
VHSACTRCGGILGAAINGKRAGETARFWLPDGRADAVEILEAVQRRVQGRRSHGDRRCDL